MQALISAIMQDAKEKVEKTSDLTAHLPLCTALGLCYSALFNLYATYSCIDDFAAEQLKNTQLQEMQHRAFAGLKEAADAVSEYSERIRAAGELGGIMRTSPLVSDCLYQAAATCLWYNKESGTQTWRDKMIKITEVLKMIGVKWSCAGK